MKTTLCSMLLALGLSGPALVQNATAAPAATSAASASPTKEVVVAKNSRPWPHELSKLKVDPKITWGRLDNGLRYAILPHREATGRASLQMHLKVGSMYEENDQQGIAHFLEHMAFNGTKNFPAGETLERFQRYGLSFGAHTNASTGLDETIYKMELPRANEELTGESLKFFRDVLDGMLLNEKEIEQERGVVLSELLARNSASYRSLVAMLQFTLPGAVASSRMPIGTAAHIRSMPRQRFVDFYQKWYTPGRATIVAVGDFDVPMVEKMIKEKFAEAKAVKGEAPEPSLGKITLADKPVAASYTDPAAEHVAVVLQNLRPAAIEVDSLETRAETLKRTIALAMLKERLEKIAASTDSPLLSVHVDHQRQIEMTEAERLVATCSKENWSKAIPVLEQEIRRALKHGFSDGEFTRAVAVLKNTYETEVQGATTKQASSLVAGLLATFNQNEVWTSAEEDLALFTQMMPGISKEDCLKTLQAKWDPSKVRLWVQGNLEIRGDAEKQILAAYQLSQFMPVSPLADEADIKLAYTDFGPAGKIVEKKQIEDLELLQAKFANNVRVNIKRTAIERNNVRVMVRFGGGLLELPAEKAGLNLLANAAYISGGLQAHSLNELNRIIGSKQLSVQFAVGEDAFLLAGMASPAELETQLQVTTAYLTAAGFRPEALKSYAENLDAILTKIERTPEGVAGNAVIGFLRGDDARFVIPAEEKMRKWTLDDLKAWLAKPQQSGYVEVSIVGDIDPEVALNLVAKTLGALPEREATKPDFAEQRALKYPAGVKEKTFEFSSDTSRGASLVSWPAPGHRDIPLGRRVSVLGEVLNDRLRLKVREELGATYSPEVVRYSSEAFRDYGNLIAVMLAEPKDLANLGSIAARVADELAKGEISDDEFKRAISPTLSTLDQRDNSYWLNNVSNSQEMPEMVEVMRTRNADYRAITKDEVQALAKKLLSSEHATVINVQPKVAK